jgi:hypothetical protein
LSAVQFCYVAVVNEVAEDMESIMSAMRNLDRALSADGIIKVSTAVQMDVLGSNFPPSAGSFSQGYMAHVAQYMQSTGAPLLANVCTLTTPT